MTKLEKLYSIIENSREVGVKLTKEVLQQVEELEEGIIKEEILPALSSDIAPRLEPIRRDLVLVVEYHPGEPISVALSRKAKISEILDAKTLTPRKKLPVKTDTKHDTIEPLSDVIVISLHNIQEVQGRDIRITVNGKVFQERNAIQTFIEALKFIGLDEVAKVGIMCSGYNLVDTRQRLDGGKRWQQQEGNKWVYVYFSNITKVNYLMQIADFLKLNIKIEAI